MGEPGRPAPEPVGNPADGMARPTLLLVLALLLCSSTEAEAQFWERFSFREAFSASRGRSRPASFSILLPGDTTPSYSVRTALKIDLGFGSLGQKVDIGPYVEYRLLTNIKRPQNVFMVGLSADWETRDEEAEQQRWSAIMIMRVNYKNDFERATKSVQTNVNFTPVARDRGGGLANLFLPNVPTQFGSAVEFTYSPSIGLEHEGVVRAEDELRVGSVVRLVSGIKAELLPLPSHLARRLELNIEYSYVYDVKDYEAPDQLNRGHQLVRADMNVWFVRTDAGRLAGVSLKYTGGESPSVGFRPQRVTELTFSLKF